MQHKQNKITEKQFLRVLISSAFGIVLCLICLVGTTWAWYTLTISSEDNTIRVGSFAAEVAVTSNDGGTAIPASGELTYGLPAGEYTVRISSSTGNTVPGYCVIKFAGQTHETVRLYPAGSGDGKPSAVEFTVKVGVPVQQNDPEGEGTGEKQTREIYTAQLQIIPMWGEPALTGDLLGGTVVEITNGAEAVSDSEPSEDTEESTPDDSTPDDSTPTESTPTESTPTESTPTESTPTESTPTESTPTESTPTESTPTESTPTESTPTESTPAESTPTESTPTESTPVESTPEG